MIDGIARRILSCGYGGHFLFLHDDAYDLLGAIIRDHDKLSPLAFSFFFVPLGHTGCRFFVAANFPLVRLNDIHHFSGNALGPQGSRVFSQFVSLVLCELTHP